MFILIALLLPVHLQMLKAWKLRTPIPHQYYSLTVALNNNQLPLHKCCGCIFLENKRNILVNHVPWKIHSNLRPFIDYQCLNHYLVLVQGIKLQPHNAYCIQKSLICKRAYMALISTPKYYGYQATPQCFRSSLCTAKRMRKKWNKLI